MVNWISCEEEKRVRKINFANLHKVIDLARDSQDEMTKYVCEIFDEYKDIISNPPELLKDILVRVFKDKFVVDGIIENSDIIISPSDANAYHTIKALNAAKKDLTVVCFDMHSDTYDYNDSLWKGNSFSHLMNEGYINHYIVIGVPLDRRLTALNDANPELLDRIYLIDEEELTYLLKLINPENIFISIDVDCFDCRAARYTAVEYSPSTILNHVSHLDNIKPDTINEQIRSCVYVKNDLGYSNYYHTGENNLTLESVMRIIDNVINYCKKNNINIGLSDNSPFLQIMEVCGYDYGNLTSAMVIKLINEYSRR